VGAVVVAAPAVLAGLAAIALLLALDCTDDARLDNVGAASAGSVARQESIVDVVVIVESTTLWI
jgi:hypothetical protein